MQQPGGWLIPLALIMFLAFALADCGNLPPAPPATDAGQWHTYSRKDAGPTIDVPATFQPE